MQTLEDFVKEVREEIGSFYDYWREQNKVNPKEWPLEMEDGNEGGWWEQFIAYESLRGKEIV